MTSKTKLLKKGKYIPGVATPAPAKKAENKATQVASNKPTERDIRKEAEARSRARRMRSILKLGIKKEQVQKWFAEENNRMVLVLLNGQYTTEDGVRGYKAAKKYIDDEKLTFMGGSPNAIWILSDVNNVDNVVEKLKILGRVSVTKPEPHTKESTIKYLKDKKKTEETRKPSNNTEDTKKNAKKARKEDNKSRAAMRPYYAALRKGGVSARIKKYNKALAKKIEKWLKEHKALEAEKAEKSKEYRAKHRQLTSLEMKANKRARKASKHLAAQERRKEREKERMKNNEALTAKRVQNAKKPVQTELKEAA